MGVALCVFEECTDVIPQVASPPLRTNRTRRVLHPVLIGHAASFTPYKSDVAGCLPQLQRAGAGRDRGASSAETSESAVPD